jgi:hypothetical protein
MASDSGTQTQPGSVILITTYRVAGNGRKEKAGEQKCLVVKREELDDTMLCMPINVSGELGQPRWYHAPSTDYKHVA